MKQIQLTKIFLDQNKDPIWMIDTDFKLVYANQAYFSMVKVLTGEETKLNNSVFVEGFGVEHIEKWKIYYKRAINGEYFEFEDHIYHPETNDVQYSLVSFKPVVGDNQEVVAVACQSKNITKEKKLKELNLQVNRLAKIGSWEVNLVNHSIFWSDEVHQMHETDSKMFVPSLEEAINFYREDFRELVSQSVEKCISSGEPYDFEAVIVTAKNKELWVRAIGNAEFVDGTCTRLYGSFQDINDRKEAELRLQLLADNLPGVVFQYYIYPDGTDRLLSVTQGSKDVWGFTAEEVMENIQLVWNQILLGGDIEKVKKSILDSVESKSKWSARWKYVMPNEELKTHLGYGSPSYLSDGTVVFNSVILDITTDAKNEELLEQVSKMAKIGGWELNLKTMTPYFSEQTFKIYDLPLGTPPKVEDGIKFYAKEAQPIITKAVTEAIENHTPYHLELPFITAKGNKIWVRTSGNVEVLDGKAIRLYGAIQDITEKKLTEKELNSLTERLQLATKAANVGIWDWDIKQNKLIWDEEMYAIFNVDPSEFDGAYEAWEATVHPDDIEQANKDVENAINGISDFDSSFRIIWKDKSIHYIKANGMIERDKKGKAIRMIGTNWDITKEKIAEEEIRFKANLLSMVRQAVIATNLDGEVSYWNKAAEIMYGWKQEEALGMNIMQLTPIDTNKEEALQIMEILKKGESWSGEFEVQKKDGTNFIAMITNSPIYDGNNKLKGIIGISSDITQEIKNKELLKQYTKELERSNEELEQFAFVASHDLQEPLRMISSFMNLLDKKYGNKLDEKANQYIHFAIDGAKSMKHIILDLLEYSRARVSTEGKEEVDMNEVLIEFKDLRRKFILEKKALIKSNKLPTLYTYKVAVKQVFHCLVDNAIKYSKKDVPPIVEINAIENEKEWEFSIKDNGIGIDPQFYDKIFIIFQRLHNKDQFSGTGIGLSVAKRHIEFLGGRIWLESEPGKGSVFYFTISKTT